MNPLDSSQPSRYQAPEFLSGVVERITYHAEQSGYTVARLQSPRAIELVTVIGNSANIQAGQTLELLGGWCAWALLDCDRLLQDIHEHGAFPKIYQ